MSIDQRINTKIIACDIAERIGCFEPSQCWQVKQAVDEYGADMIWDLADDAIHLERVTGTSRRTLFFALLQQYRQERCTRQVGVTRKGSQ
jgi:hypothetical protein